MEEAILALMMKYPATASVLVVMGILRAIFKPLFSLLQAYVDATESKTDNEKLQKFKDSKIYKALAYLLDYAASVKLPKAK
jgi:hypothetical protein